MWVIDELDDPRLDGHLHDADSDAQGRVVAHEHDLGKVVFVSPAGDVVDSFDARGCDATMYAFGRFYVSIRLRVPVSVFDAHTSRVAQTKAIDLIAPQFGPIGEIFALDPSSASFAWRRSLQEPSPFP